MQQLRLTTLGCLAVLLGSGNAVLGFIWGGKAASPSVAVAAGRRQAAAGPLFAQALFREDSRASSDLAAKLTADLKAAAQSGDHGKAMEILGALEKEQIPKTTVHFNRVLKALVTGKQTDKLQGVLDQMSESGACWDDTTVKLLVNAYSAQGNHAAAIDAFEKAREEELIGAVDPALYDAVLGAYRRTGAVEKAMDLCDEMRALRLNPTREGYAFIASVAIRDGKTYLIARTLETMQQEGFSAEDVAYVREVITAELPDNLKHQVDGHVVAPKSA